MGFWMTKQARNLPPGRKPAAHTMRKGSLGHVVRLL